MVFELESVYIYLGLAAWLKNENWNGFSHFMEIQYQEEFKHTMKFYNYLADVGQELYFDELSVPKKDYKSVEEVFQLALKHEKAVTKRIHDLVEMAKEEKDYAANNSCNGM